MSVGAESCVAVTPVLFGIGYEKAALDDVLTALDLAEIRMLVDVRERPQSRRAGFSKRLLAASLAAREIDYRHLKALGTPPEGRLAHRAGDEVRFRAIVAQQLLTSQAQAALDELATLARAARCCVLCYEADWKACHRRQIMEILNERGVPPVHLTPIATG